MLQTRLDQRECHTRIANLTPAKAHALLQHPRDFRNVAVRIRIRRTATNHDQASLFQRQSAIGFIRAINRLLNTARSGGDHLGINTQFTTIADRNTMLCGIGIQYRRNIILGVHRSKQHPRHGQNPITARLAQVVQPITDHRVRELQIAVIAQPIVGQIRRQFLGQRREFINRRL